MPRTSDSEFRFIPVWRYYRCDGCNRTFTTVQVDQGIVAEQMPCKLVVHTPSHGCQGTLGLGATNDLRNWPLRARHNAEAEWYRPSGEYQMAKMKKQAPKLYEFIKNGGLVLRPPTSGLTFPSSLEQDHG